MSLKEIIRKNFLETVNAAIEKVKNTTEPSLRGELADFLSDYGKDTGSLLYCYEYITEEEHDKIVAKVNAILKNVKQEDQKKPATSPEVFFTGQEDW